MKMKDKRYFLLANRITDDEGQRINANDGGLDYG